MDQYTAICDGLRDVIAAMQKTSEYRASSFVDMAAPITASIAVSGIEAQSNIDRLIYASAAAETATVTASLDRQTGMKSGATEIAGVGAALGEMMQLMELYGAIAAVGNAIAEIEQLMELYGDTDGAATIAGHIESLMELYGTTDATTSITGTQTGGT